MKVADVKLEWDASVSNDIDHSEISISINGVSQTVTVSNDVKEATIEVQANSSVMVQAKTIDKEGNEVLSVTYTFNTGDLEAPQPLTNFRHTILGVRDVPDPEPVPPAPVEEV